MLNVDKQKVSLFAKRYLLVFALGVCGWELSRYADGGNDFDLYDLLEAVALFIAFFFFAVLLVSFFQGWIEFRPNDD